MKGLFNGKSMYADAIAAQEKKAEEAKVISSACEYQ